MSHALIFLNRKFDEIKSRNPMFSQRAFASKIGISPGAMNSVLNGKRPISKKLATKVTKALNLNNDEIKDFMMEFFEEEKDKKRRLTSFNHFRLEMEQYRVISQWQHLALLNLINCIDYRPDYSWMAMRLGIPHEIVSESMERMLEIGLVKRENDSFVRSKAKIKTPDDILSESLRDSHRQTLELAMDSLKDVDIEARDLTAMTMAIDPKKLKYAKSKIREFLFSLSEELEDGEQSEVYKMAIQLFPLTKT